MSVKIINKETLIEKRVKNSEGIESSIFFGSMKEQNNRTDIVKKTNGEELRDTVVAESMTWKNSEGHARLWSQIEDSIKKVKNQLNRKVNINQFPDDYYDLINRIKLDITRRRIQEPDFTSEFTQEITNVNFPKSIPLIEFLPFAGAFEVIKGTGDNVPMLEQKTGATDAVSVLLRGLGHARSLEDELYNTDIYSLEKVNAAVARAHTGIRNDICFGPLIALTAATGWNASQQVPADTVGATYDEQVYLTLRNALRTLYGLLDPQTKQEIDAPRVVLLVRNNVIQWDIARIVDGQLDGYGSNNRNRRRLPIDEVWLYKGDVIDVGPKRTEYEGVPDGTAYLFVPGPAGAPTWTLNKRQLTQEVGRGDVLTLSREQRAWYFGQAVYREEFLGSSSDTAGLGDGYGYVVEITLPTEPGET